MPRFEVLTYTICDGWVNCWTVNGKPQTFATYEQAKAELAEHLREYEISAALGDISEDSLPDPDDFMIEKVGEILWRRK